MKLIYYLASILASLAYLTAWTAQQVPAPPTPQTTTPPPASPVQSQQLKWPDTIEISEKDTPLISKKETKDIFNQADKVAGEMDAIVDKMDEERDKVRTLFYDIDRMTNEFSQTASQHVGSLTQLLATKDKVSPKRRQ